MEVPDCAAAVKAGMPRNCQTSSQSVGQSVLLLRYVTEEFILANPIQNMNKAGTCPHGAPLGACPICNGMGGSGGRVGERPQKAGEMSYHECAMIGAMMRAREAAQKEHEQTLLHRAEAMKTFEENLLKFAQKLADFTSNFQKYLPLKPVAVIINNIVVPIIKTIANISHILTNLGEKFAQIKEKIIDIQDKLNAIFGEAKAFVEKKVSELVSNLKSKIKSIFKVFKRNNTKDDETKIDEEKKIFRLKTFIQRILKKHKEK